ncbi:dnaJ homolog subfamily C member 12 [Lingula anatina]|uniref:DnaJ homolog subfamily C member 12 n=1 Tax=Lingula anatina TaxID=7574 RepID=A0A1S3JM02_LINAN|nr:dnaJ homolog subfamily C member 12 [Lingula anatina]|eukprot:XP_013411413.1 dnaJ homolog subfamily C member 12 [Lingula anatina]
MVDAALNSEINSEDDYYHILGCDELSTMEQIYAEYKARVMENHPDKCQDDPKATERFAKLQRAKETLTNDDTRQKYDLWRRSGLAIPYEQWASLRDTVHTSMHWMDAKKEAMLPQASDFSDDVKGYDVSSNQKRNPEGKVHMTDISHLNFGGVPWERDPPSEALRKFRNYEI